MFEILEVILHLIPDKYSKCSKVLHTYYLPKKALTNSADTDQTASERQAFLDSSHDNQFFTCSYRKENVLNFRIFTVPILFD